MKDLYNELTRAIIWHHCWSCIVICLFTYINIEKLYQHIIYLFFGEAGNNYSDLFKNDMSCVEIASLQSRGDIFVRSHV